MKKTNICNSTPPKTSKTGRVKWTLLKGHDSSDEIHDPSNELGGLRGAWDPSALLTSCFRRLKREFCESKEIIHDRKADLFFFFCSQFDIWMMNLLVYFPLGSK